MNRACWVVHKRAFLCHVTTQGTIPIDVPLAPSIIIAPRTEYSVFVQPSKPAPVEAAPCVEVRA